MASIELSSKLEHCSAQPSSESWIRTSTTTFRVSRPTVRRSRSTFPGNRTPPNCFEDSHASTTLERHILNANLGLRTRRDSRAAIPNSIPRQFFKEGRVGLEPTQGCLTGTCSATELPTRSNVKCVILQTAFLYSTLNQSGTPESNREPQASKAHVLPSAPVPVFNLTL